MIRAIVTDDSPVMRRMIGDVLRAAGDIEVVATAEDGAEAVAACRTHQPDVLTLDLSMPGMDGLQVLAALQRAKSPVRVVVVSSFSPSLVERALDVLDAGATDLVAKPRVGESFAEFGNSVVAAVRTAAGGRRQAERPEAPRVVVPRPSRAPATQSRVLMIASSTGGPSALGAVVPKLPGTLGAGAVLVQHMPPTFTGALARRLDESSQLRVREAAAGDVLASDTLYVAPGGKHLRLSSSGAFRLDETEAIGGVRPRADLTIDDLVERHGSRVVLVVMTGMGNDGLAGARAVRAAGGIVLAQDERDCVVYGMPRHVVEHDLADATGTLSELPVLIERAMGTLA